MVTRFEIKQEVASQSTPALNRDWKIKAYLYLFMLKARMGQSSVDEGCVNICSILVATVLQAYRGVQK